MQNHLRLLTPGPTAIPDRVRLAMAMPMIHHRKPEFKAVLEETRFYLKKLFGTEQEVLPLARSGTGAMTAAVINLFSRGEKRENSGSAGVPLHRCRAWKSLKLRSLGERRF